jgi:hypothetical protein
MREYHVLNLGAGVQSTTLYLLDERLGHGGDLRFDVAIFADTQAEPKAVYDHLELLRCRQQVTGGPPIWIRTGGNLEEDVKNVRSRSSINSNTNIPAFTAEHHETRTEFKGASGIISRQCTRDYKIDVIEQAIRREIVGLKYRQRMPKDVRVHQYFGITVDEARRMASIKNRYDSIFWAEPHFPLIDKGWSRRGCLEWLKGKFPYEVPRSACVFCPYRNDHEWRRMKDNDPDGWSRAVAVDTALRSADAVAKRRTRESLYLHRSCIPLEMVNFDNLPPQTLEPFTLYDCVGMCGN